MRQWLQSWTAPSIFVASVWLTMLAAAAAFVWKFGSPEPFGDEWDLLPGVTYSEPYLRWLWAQHNEHRLPLPKLLYTWLLNLSGFDTRAGSLATIAVLASLALAFTITARNIRGTTEYADAYFSIAFLNWGHFENYLIGFQISFALTVGLVCLWYLATTNGGPLRAVGLALLMLPLCGAHGLVFVGPLGIATLWLNRKSAITMRVAIAMTVLISWTLSAAYFLSYVSPKEHPHSAGLLASLKIAIEVLSLGWGWVGQMIWPFSGVGIALALLASGTMWFGLIRRNMSLDRLVAIGAVAIGSIGLAFGIGWGRSGFGPEAGFAVRYGILTLPLMAGLYLFWLQFGGRILGSLVPMGFFTIACLFLTQHSRSGLAEGQASAIKMGEFARDVRAGYSPDVIASRHPAVYPQPAALAERIRLLQAAGFPRYAAQNAAANR